VEVSGGHLPENVISNRRVGPVPAAHTPLSRLMIMEKAPGKQ